MKKILALICVLALCMTGVASAETIVYDAKLGAVPSRSTADLASVEIVTELPEGNELSIILKDTEASQAQIEALRNAPSVEEFFGNVKDADGNAADISEALGAETLNINEFMSVIVSGSQEEYGDIEVKITFATPYEEGEKVLIMVSTPETGWVELAGGAAGGSIDVIFPQKLMTAMQNGDSFLAAISKAQ